MALYFVNMKDFKMSLIGVEKLCTGDHHVTPLEIVFGMWFAFRLLCVENHRKIVKMNPRFFLSPF